MLTQKQKYEKYRPKKFLGQNFLVDENIARKIVNSLNADKEDAVLEIGPGQGILTKYLLKNTPHLTAVELDKSICINLKEKYGDSLNLVHGDFLKFDLQNFCSKLPDGKKLKIIGNIPYNITSEILFKLFDFRNRIDIAVLMMQKEVAYRLKALPDTKDYGILAVYTQVNAIPEILFSVSSGSFFPKPKVESSVVRLTFGNSRFKISQKELFKELVKSSFGKRRKTLRNSLSLFFEKHNLNQSDFEFDFGRRAENVSVEEYVMLSDKINEMQNA